MQNKNVIANLYNKFEEYQVYMINSETVLMKLHESISIFHIPLSP